MLSEMTVRAKLRERKRLVYSLAAESEVEWRTVEKWLRGDRVSNKVAKALEQASERFSEEVARHRGVAA